MRRAVRLFSRGLVKHCPRCGAGKLFTRWTRMADRCPGCGYRFARQPGFLTGGLAINIIVTELVFFVFLVVAMALTLPHPPVLLLVIMGVAINAVVPIIYYPFSKTVWAAVDLVMRPLEPHEEAEAALARERARRGA